MKKCLVAFAAFMLVPCVVGCAPKPGIVATTKRSGEPDVAWVKGSDAEMNAAIAKARATLPQFVAALSSPQKGRRAFAVKKRFSYGSNGSGEHMWISRLRYDGQLLRGVLNDVPVEVKTVKFGDAVTVAPSELSDWMFVDNGKLVGGTTMRVLYNRLSPAEQQQMQREMGCRIE